MRRMLTLSPALLIVFAASSLCGTAHAQANGELVRRDGNAPFASINERLGKAADTALTFTTDSAKTANSNDHEAPKPTDPTVGITTRNSQMHIQSILEREGIPAELSAVMKVESSGNIFALSPKGARGPWQIMPETARRYGLQVDSRIDERVDVEKSTTAAARYLRDLHAQFGSWPLALAAYNTGEANLQRAINRAQSNQFAVLSFLKVIPAETRNYVPAVLANIPPSFSLPEMRATESFPTNLVYAGSAGSQELSSEGKR